MEKICPNCGAEMPNDAVFCGECGTKMNSNESSIGSVMQGDSQPESVDSNAVDYEKLKMESENSRLEVERIQAEAENKRLELERAQAEAENNRLELERIQAEAENKRLELERDKHRLAEEEAKRLLNEKLELFLSEGFSRYDNTYLYDVYEVKGGVQKEERYKNQSLSEALNEIFLIEQEGKKAELVKTISVQEYQENKEREKERSALSRRISKLKEQLDELHEYIAVCDTNFEVYLLQRVANTVQLLQNISDKSSNKFLPLLDSFVNRNRIQFDVCLKEMLSVDDNQINAWYKSLDKNKSVCICEGLTKQDALEISKTIEAAGGRCEVRGLSGLAITDQEKVVIEKLEKYLESHNSENVFDLSAEKYGLVINETKNLKEELAAVIPGIKKKLQQPGFKPVYEGIKYPVFWKYDGRTLKITGEGCILDHGAEDQLYYSRGFNHARLEAEELVIQGKIDRISRKTFSNSSVKTVSLSKSVCLIEYEAFYSCNNLKKVIAYNDDIIIQKGAFEFCGRLNITKVKFD